MRSDGRSFRVLAMGGIGRRSALKGGLAALGAVTAAAHPSSAAATPVPAVTAGRFDTVIVGTGCAGLARAIDAHDRGGRHGGCRRCAVEHRA
jgi:hypothetical protein